MAASPAWDLHSLGVGLDNPAKKDVERRLRGRSTERGS